MGKLGPIVQFEFRTTLRKRGYQIVTLAVPAAGLAVILISYLLSGLSEEAEPTVRGYVDHWGRLPTELPADAGLRPFSSEEAAKGALLHGQVEAYFVVPPDYVATGLVEQYTTSDVDFFGDEDELALLRLLLIQGLVTDRVGAEIARRVQQPVLIDRTRLTAEGEVAPEEGDEFSRFVIPYGFSILLFMSIAWSSNMLVQSVTEEKQSQTVEVLLSSVSSFMVMGGKVLGMGGAGLLQALVWLLSAAALSRLAGAMLDLPTSLAVQPEQVALGGLFFVLGYLFYGSLSAGVGALMPSPQEASQFSPFVTMLAITPVLFIETIVSEPSGLVARLLTLVPITSPVTVMLRMSAVDLPWMDIVGGAVLLALAGLGSIFVSARLFRTFLLLYGRRPGLREVWRALRTA